MCGDLNWQSVDKHLYEAEIDAFRQGRFGIAESIRSVRQELASQGNESPQLSGQNDDKSDENQKVLRTMEEVIEAWEEKMWKEWKAKNYLGVEA